MSDIAAVKRDATLAAHDSNINESSETSPIDHLKTKKLKTETEASLSTTTTTTNTNITNISNDSTTIATTSELKSESESLLPVTVISGFLGAGKTTILKQLLQNKPQKSQSKLNAIVTKELELNEGDLSGGDSDNHSGDKIVALQNGCICCGIRKDLILQVQELAEMKRFDYLVIESSGISEPAPIAMTLCHSIDELESMAGMDQESNKDNSTDAKSTAIAAIQLKKSVKLDTMVTVADSSQIVKHLTGSKKLMRLKDSNMKHQLEGGNGHGEEDCDDPENHESDKHEHEHLEDPDRPLVDLLVEQIEFANVIILSKRDLLLKESEEEVGDKFNHLTDNVEQVVRMLNPKAKIIWTENGKVQNSDSESNITSHMDLNTNLFSLPEAQTSAGWLQELEKYRVLGEGKKEGKSTKKKLRTIGHSPKEFGVNSLIFNSNRPFHPMRLNSLLDGLAQGVDFKGKFNGKEDKDSNKNGKEDKKNLPLSRVIRSKGKIWLANCCAYHVDWHSVGRFFRLYPGQPFISAQKEAGIEVDEEEEGENNGNETKNSDNDNSDSHAPWGQGDRHTELVLIGVNLNKPELLESLNSALVNDEEWEKACEEKRELDRKVKELEEEHEKNSDGKEEDMPDIDLDLTTIMPTFCSLEDPFFRGDAVSQFMCINPNEEEEEDGEEDSDDEDDEEEDEETDSDQSDEEDPMETESGDGESSS